MTDDDAQMHFLLSRIKKNKTPDVKAETTSVETPKTQEHKLGVAPTFQATFFPPPPAPQNRQSVQPLTLHPSKVDQLPPPPPSVFSAPVTFPPLPTSLNLFQEKKGDMQIRAPAKLVPKKPNKQERKEITLPPRDQREVVKESVPATIFTPIPTLIPISIPTPALNISNTTDDSTTSITKMGKGLEEQEVQSTEKKDENKTQTAQIKQPIITVDKVDEKITDKVVQQAHIEVPVSQQPESAAIMPSKEAASPPEVPITLISVSPDKEEGEVIEDQILEDESNRQLREEQSLNLEPSGADMKRKSRSTDHTLSKSIDKSLPKERLSLKRELKELQRLRKVEESLTYCLQKFTELADMKRKNQLPPAISTRFQVVRAALQ